jgi:hypothetical protein
MTVCALAAGTIKPNESTARDRTTTGLLLSVSPQTFVTAPNNPGASEARVSGQYKS